MSEFKKGDTVKCVNDGQASLTHGRTYKINSVSRQWGSTYLKVRNDAGFRIGYDSKRFEKVSKYPNPPHMHTEVIKAWADGAQIQFRNSPELRWRDCPNPPAFSEFAEYRIKPEKTEAEVELEKLQDQINELTKQAEKLKKKL